jgi:peptide/nickel transport system ATP-binding protein
LAATCSGCPIANASLLKGRDLSMVFQDPGTSLNPVFRIGAQLDDIMAWADRRGGERSSRKTRRVRILEVLRQVKLPDPALVYDAYPMQLSGGMRQRVLIAMALLNRPTLLIADEPGTALDVTTQDEILRLLDTLVHEEGLSMLLISHNLGVVRAMTDRLYVMYAGAIVEEGATPTLFQDPRHPYTQALMRCVPRLDGSGTVSGIDGTLPDYVHPPPGCRFHPRCPHAHHRCLERPPAVEVTAGHRSACWLEVPSDAWPGWRRHPRRRGAQQVVPDTAWPAAAHRRSRARPRPGVVRGPIRRGVRPRRRVRLGQVDSGPCGSRSRTRQRRSVRVAGLEVHRQRDRRALGELVQMVFQNPGSSLNPRRSIQQTLALPLAMRGLSGLALHTRTAELLEMVELPRSFRTKHPHELSGGQKQRVAIARALAAGAQALGPRRTDVGARRQRAGEGHRAPASTAT